MELAGMGGASRPCSVSEPLVGGGGHSLGCGTPWANVTSPDIQMFADDSRSACPPIQ